MLHNAPTNWLESNNPSLYRSQGDSDLTEPDLTLRGGYSWAVRMSMSIDGYRLLPNGLRASVIHKAAVRLRLVRVVGPVGVEPTTERL